jgi:hypothetical protein
MSCSPSRRCRWTLRDCDLPGRPLRRVPCDRLRRLGAGLPRGGTRRPAALPGLRRRTLSGPRGPERPCPLPKRVQRCRQVLPAASQPRIRTFSVHCRERFGRTVGKIPLDLGIPCPNRARGGCLFCRPASFTPFSLRTADSLDEQIQRGRRLLLRGRFSSYFGYFQQETPTALATEHLLPLLPLSSTSRTASA